MLNLYHSYEAPQNKTYQGHVQRATFTFSTGPEQFDFINNFFKDRYIDECVKAVYSQSPADQVLKLEIYRDTSPTWKTPYELVITATDVTGNPLPWLLIIGVALALVIVYFVIRPTLKSVQDLVYGPTSSDGKSTGVNLVSMIPWIVGGLAAWLLLGRSPPVVNTVKKLH